jgi:hypothetical protein
MDKFWTFIGNMTVWNWITLVAFLIALMSGLNAFLSLKSRYLDWKGVQSKKGFKKRLQELEVQLFAIEQYKKQPSTFFIQVLDDARKPAILFMAFCCFVTISFFLASTRGMDYQLIFMLGLFCFLGAFKLATRLSNLIARVSTPELFAIDVIKFVNNAKRKGLLPLDDNTLVEKLLKSEMFSPSQRRFVEQYVNTHLIAKT